MKKLLITVALITALALAGLHLLKGHLESGTQAGVNLEGRAVVLNQILASSN